MRLLTHDPNGNLVLETRDDSSLPPYAILSHTWLEDNSHEVTLDDLQTGQAVSKPGYNKIRFCERQAAADGLRYFWIDTCCIDKSDKVEESQSIRSMFRWYRNAARCYVYLVDVPTLSTKRKRDQEATAWESAFRASRWFTRGWTLQELLAPRNVEFFSEEQHKIGDKASLERQISTATGIPSEALRGASLSEFTIEDRQRWGQHRKTKQGEDGAYALQGICGVELLPRYGEGAVKAFERLDCAINDRRKCVRDISDRDPQDDKKRIEDTKGGLLRDSYRWVFSNANFQQWREDQRGHFLWIKGDPGKGKTMLLCGIIDELQMRSQTTNMSYFLFQATDSRINNAVAALRGLLYRLVQQQPLLISHVRKKYDDAGKAMFEDVNAWVVLTKIFADILQDPGLDPTYLLIDALDECVVDLDKLLAFLTKQSTASFKVKWLVSSRNWPQIEERLEQAGKQVKLSLELSAESVSAAVQFFIEHKVSRLVQQKKYDKSTRVAVLEHLQLKANDTFLWVALVCQNLETTSKRHTLKKLESFPLGLDDLYARMMPQIDSSEDSEVCKHILGVAALAYRPLTLAELTALAEHLKDFANDLDSVHKIVGLCGSFLTLRDDTIYFVH